MILLENLRFLRSRENSLDLPGKSSIHFRRSLCSGLVLRLFIALMPLRHKIPQLLPHCRGFLPEKEVTNSKPSSQNPKPQVTVIIGGAKISDKQPLIDRFLSIADHILVVGKIAADGYISSDPKIYVAEFSSDQEGNKLDIGDLSLSKILPTIKYSHWYLEWHCRQDRGTRL